MFVERKIDPVSNRVELWWADGAPGASRTLVSKIGEEQPLAFDSGQDATDQVAICWANGRTLGNIGVRSPALLSHFTAKQADQAILPCDFVYAGRYRHGVDRWWCRTHQSHWGVKADIAALQSSGVFRCAAYQQPMSYVVDPYTIRLSDHAEVGVWCSLPAALSTFEIEPRPPKIHVHVRNKPDEAKHIDRDFSAITVVYGSRIGLFADGNITRVDITPPAAFDFVCGLEANQEMGCIDCPHCSHPHLDLGEFGKTPHRKHFCSNCGRDSTWSKVAIISTPLKPLHDHSATHLTCVMPDRRLNLDEYQGCHYSIWASTPAIVWTASRPQEYGIHVHVHKGRERIIDDTFGEVILKGRPLVREELLRTMIGRTVI